MTDFHFTGKFVAFGFTLSADILLFNLVVVLLLGADFFLLSRPGKAISQRAAWLWTGFIALLAGGFALWLGWEHGSQSALEFTSGYLIESSLSVDNLFVFLLLFRSFGLSLAQQHRALQWGVLGAIVMRAVFVLAGVALLDRFRWLEYVFGAFLLVAAIRLLRKPEAGARPPRWQQWLRQRAGEGRTLLIVILAVELSDLVFALDSIPAVLAITRDPMLVYTSNIFAVLGLRSLYFALAGLLDRFHLLHYGLAAILAFVAFKMLAAEWVQVPTLASLVVILAILALSVLLSLRRPPRPASAQP